MDRNRLGNLSKNIVFCSVEHVKVHVHVHAFRFPITFLRIQRRSKGLCLTILVHTEYMHTTNLNRFRQMMKKSLITKDKFQPKIGTRQLLRGFDCWYILRQSISQYIQYKVYKLFLFFFM